MGDDIPDERFAHIAKDPRFRPVPKHEKKVKIDKRFTSMFNDKKFKLSYSVDKRGLPIHGSKSDDLKKFYNISSESESESDEQEEILKGSKKSSSNKAKLKQSENSEKNENFEETESESEANSDEEVKKEIDLARGEGNVETSSDDDSDEDLDDADGNVYHDWGELDADAPKVDQISRRLAICNMDWDRIKAQDLFVLFHSFKPAEGVVKAVWVYPSEFGIQRLKDENMRGPAELVDEKLESDQEDYAETPEGSKYHMEKLRKYQLNRLRYYYAVVECDTEETANQLYKELEGMEYESSAAQIDLRFVPEDMEFEHEPVSVCETLPDMTTYKPVLFTTTALQQGKVDLTWDETHPERTERLEKAFENTGDENDLRAYLASSSSEDEGIDGSNDEETVNVAPTEKLSETKQISKYKALLAEIEEQEKKKEDEKFGIEIKWEPGLKSKTEELVKKQLKKKEVTTPFEEYLEKKKDKKKNRKKIDESFEEKVISDEEQHSQAAFSDDELPDDVDFDDPFFKEFTNTADFKSKSNKKKKLKNKEERRKTEDGTKQTNAELELLMMDEEDESKHFKLKDLVEETNLTKSKKKRLLKKRKHVQKAEKEDNFQIDVSDPRFSALYSSALYNIDPSDPQYKKTKATEALVVEKQKRRKDNPEAAQTASDQSQTASKGKGKVNPSLSLLVNSVKNKTQNYKRKKS